MSSSPVDLHQAITQKLKTPRLPGDKSISHRVLLMSAMSVGVSRIKNISQSEDVIATQNILRSLGVRIWSEGDVTNVEGRGFKCFSKPFGKLDAKNSGTTARHILGLLAFEDFETTLVGDDSLSKRPMARIVEPLCQMGAAITLAGGGLPAKIHPAHINKTHFDYELKIASGQVKSSLFLVAAKNGLSLNLKGQLHGRDHTEKLIPFFGGEIKTSEDIISLPVQPAWKAVEWTVPSDLSAAAFWIAKVLMEENSWLKIEDVGLNPSRMGFINALKKMNANIVCEVTSTTPELVGNIYVQSGKLKPIEITEVTDFIDEVPLLVMICSQIQGRSTISGAKELKYKESDRILATKEVLESVGVKVQITDDGFVIDGPQAFCDGVMNPCNDHRLAMLGLVAKATKNSNIQVLNTECAAVSDPGFIKQISEVIL